MELWNKLEKLQESAKLTLVADGVKMLKNCQSKQGQHDINIKINFFAGWANQSPRSLNVD